VPPPPPVPDQHWHVSIDLGYPISSPALKPQTQNHVNVQAALVVYDEIHYLRDKERGVVWEESIILMPKTVRFAFLSATIPNAAEFAQWIAKTHR